MRIAHVIQQCYLFGGAERATLQEVQALRQAGADAVLCLLTETRDNAPRRLSEAAAALEIPCYEIAVEKRISPAAILALYRWLKREEIAVLHPHTTKPEVYSLAAAVPARVPLVGEFHGWCVDPHARLRDLPLRAPRGEQALPVALHERMQPYLWRLMEKLMVLTRQQEQIAIAAGVPAHKIAYMPRGYAYEELLKSGGRRDFRREFALSGKFVVGTIGRLSPEKNQAILIEAFAELTDRQAHLLIAGEGALSDQLYQQTVSLGIADRVRFVGFTDAVADFLSALDVFVLPSLREGLPRSLLEAMALGVACIGSSVGGIAEVIDDRKTGLLCAPDDVDGLGRALELLSSDQLKRQRLATAARKVAFERYHISAWAEAALELYQRVVYS